MESKLEELINQNKRTKRRSERIYCCGIDGGSKEYQVISYYDNGENLIKEKIECSMMINK